MSADITTISFNFYVAQSMSALEELAALIKAAAESADGTASPKMLHFAVGNLETNMTHLNAVCILFLT